MKHCALVSVVAVVACVQAHYPQPSDVEQRAIDAAREAWIADGRPDCDTPNGLVHATTPEHYATICLGASASTSAACFDPRAELIVFRPGLVQDWKGEPTIHEMMHALGRCSGNADSAHANPDVWKAAGGEGAVQSSAERLFIANELDAGAE